MKRHGLAFGLLCAMLLAKGTGCDAEDEAAVSGLRLSGTLGGGYRVASGLVADGPSRIRSGLDEADDVRDGESVVDRVVALRIDRGSLDIGSLLEGLDAAVDPDGTFAMTLDKSFDWVLVLVDSTAQGGDRFVGSVRIDAEEDTGDGLLEIPASTAQIGRLDLGTVARTTTGGTTDDAVASETVASQDFGMTTDQLRALSQTDDVFRNARNLIANHDPATGTWYTIVPNFSWKNSSAVAPGFSNPTEGLFAGYGLQLDTNSTSVTLQAVCGEGMPRVEVGLYPPADVAVSFPPGTVYGPSHGMTNDEVTACETFNGYPRAADRDFSAGSHDAESGKRMSYGFSGTEFPYPIPAGEWTWREAGEVRASFDLAVAAPLGADGLQGGFVPSIRVVADADGRVSATDIRWSYWDEAQSAHVPLGPEDIGLLAHAVRMAEIAFYERGHDTDTVEKTIFDPAAQTSVTAQDAWYYGVEPLPGGKRLGHVYIAFQIGGIGRVVQFVDFP